MNSLDTTTEDADEQKVENEVFPVRVDKGVREVPPRLPVFYPAMRMHVQTTSLTSKI